MIKVVAATSNKGKITEFSALFANRKDIELISMSEIAQGPEIEENGTSFIENSLIKAREVCRRSGLPALADDSGLCVDALGGEPGILSARYKGLGSDKERYLALLAALEKVETHQRTARFTCALALVLPDGREFTAEGHCEGSIGYEPKGTNGFGYDPVFIPHEHDCTMAELDPEEKNRISHRARALHALSILIQDESLV